MNYIITFYFEGKRSEDPSHPDFVPNKGVHVMGTSGTPEASIGRYDRHKKRQKMSHERLVFESNETTTGEEELSSDEDNPSQPTITKEMYDSLLEKYKLLECDHKHLKDEVTKLTNENYTLLEKIKALKFGYNVIKDNDKDIQFYTGLPSSGMFDWLISVCRVSLTLVHYILSWEDHFLILLMKLKLGLLNKDIAKRFRCQASTVSKILREWLPVISATLKPLIIWPSKMAVRQHLPTVFKGKFRNVRCVIDCTEIFIQRPNSLTVRAQTWSNYKHHNTMKYLVGVTPAGAISFISIGWGGRASDKKITCDDIPDRVSFLNMVERGDNIMADRGFLIGDELAMHGAHLKIPAFTKGRNQLSAMEVHTSRHLARARIHIERIIGQLKRFRMLQMIVPITQVDLLDDIMVICSAIVNMNKSIVPL